MEQIEKPLAILLIAAAIAFAAMNFTNADVAAPDVDLNNAVSMEGAATNAAVNVGHIAVEVSDFNTPQEEVETNTEFADTLWWFNEETQEAYFEIIKLDESFSEEGETEEGETEEEEVEEAPAAEEE